MFDTNFMTILVADFGILKSKLRFYVKFLEYKFIFCFFQTFLKTNHSIFKLLSKVKRSSCTQQMNILKC